MYTGRMINKLRNIIHVKQSTLVKNRVTGNPIHIQFLPIRMPLSAQSPVLTTLAYQSIANGILTSLQVRIVI